MASIDSLVDTLRSTIPTYSRFASKKELLDSYVLEDNPEIFMRDAWGLVVGPGDSSNLTTDYSATVDQNITIIICKWVVDAGNVGRQINEVAKDLILDEVQLRNNFLSLTKFGILSNGESITYQGHSGINRLDAGKAKIIFTESSYIFELVESIN